MQITNRVFVVTGGGNGIGREVVLGLLARGGVVAAVDLREEALAETARLAGTGAALLSTHTLDVSDADAVAALPAKVVAAHGRVDGLLNVAGIIQRFVPFADLPEADMEKVMAVNFWGVARMVKAFLPHLMTRPRACIVNVSSMGALTPVPGQTVYGASKAAVKLLTEGLRAEFGGTHVAVTVVFPGGVSTDITSNSGVQLPGTAASDGAASASLTTPADAARQIIEGGVRAGRYRVVIGKDAKAVDAMSRLSPRRATDFIAKKMASLTAS